jgi:hypothetical protein
VVLEKEITWTNHVRNEEELHRVKEDRNNLCTIQWRKANWICYILHTDCLLKHVTERTIERKSDRKRRKKT